jgi:hypothetical protein
MKPIVISVKALEKYKLFVQFGNGEKGILDLSHLAGKGVFKNWDNDNHFFEVFINSKSKAITWPGEIDIDTYDAYFKIKKLTPEEYFNQQEKHAPHL